MALRESIYIKFRLNRSRNVEISSDIFLRLVIAVGASSTTLV